MKTKPQWIHEAGDGRGPRQVYVDGVPLKMVMYADQRRGFVRVAAPDSPANHYVVRGTVEVRPL